MELENTFTVPVPPKQAFAALRDIERIGPCMPGASIDEVDGDHFSGRVKVKIGPIQVTYRGEADYIDIDDENLTATIDARGREARGSGTANAKVHAKISEGPDGGSTVVVITDLAITGKPAQFGRGVMADVSEKLIGRFADCLTEELGRDVTGSDDAATGGSDDASASADDHPADDGAVAAGDAADSQSEEAGAAGGGGASGSNGSGAATGLTAATTTGGDTAKPPAAKRPRPAEPEAIDLLEVAGAPLAQRLAPVVLGLALVAILIRLLGRRKD